jgi:TonB family protein
LHLGLILWLEDHSSIQPRPESQPLVFHIAANNNDQLWALNDPTLLALPNPHAFSGMAWLKFAPPPARPLEWTEPIEWLEPQFEKTAAAFRKFMATNQVEPEQTSYRIQPQLLLPECIPLNVRTQSGWRIEGELAEWQLLTSIILPSWPAAAILTNTLVQIVVDAAGKPFSATLLPPGSGSAEADQHALDVAQRLRFKSASERGGLTWGTLVFEWNTVMK